MKLDARAEAWVRLQVAGIGPRHLATLFRAFGEPQAVLGASAGARGKFVPANVAAAIDRAVDAERLAGALDWLREGGHELAAWDDADYPKALLEIADPPPVLFCMGRRELFGAAAFAIVGSRNATPQGCADAEAFAAALAASGLTIVSGLAAGIDAAAHRGALAHPASSIAVMGTGPDRVYPASNRELARTLALRGLVISEFTPGTPPLPGNFPRRNRVISGLSRGLLVVEATQSSGSLITARLAAEQGREVFAIPGSIHSPFSKGAHKLIREGAKLVETASDILDELRIPSAAAREADAPLAAVPHPDGAEASDAPAAILAALGHDPADVDTLIARSGLDPPTVIATLVALEIEGTLAALDGGLWQRRS